MKFYSPWNHQNFLMISGVNKSLLTHFMPLISFDTPWKHQKTSGFSDVFKGYQKKSVAWNGFRRQILSFVLSYYPKYSVKCGAGMLQWLSLRYQFIYQSGNFSRRFCAISNHAHSVSKFWHRFGHLDWKLWLTRWRMSAI